MTNSQRLATVRARLKQWLLENSRNSQTQQGEVRILRESFMIRNEFFCGRRFQCADHHAIWFIEEDELKIFQNDGALVSVLRGDELNVTEASPRPHVIKMPMPQRDEEIRRAA